MITINTIISRSKFCFLLSLCQRSLCFYLILSNLNYSTAKHSSIMTNNDINPKATSSNPRGLILPFYATDYLVPCICFTNTHNLIVKECSDKTPTKHTHIHVHTSKHKQKTGQRPWELGEISKEKDLTDRKSVPQSAKDDIRKKLIIKRYSVHESR